MTGQSDVPPLFLAFLDGVYDYVCAECTALCCKGHGFGGSLTREMSTLFRLYPGIQASVVERRGDYVGLTSPTAGCHFLGADNRCTIEVEHGKALKPGLCSLFPFNNLKRIGRAVAVAPHFLCPLRLRIPPQVGEARGTHAMVEAAVIESGLIAADRDGTGIESPPLHPDVPAQAVLARETAFRDTCADALTAMTFRETLGGCTCDASTFAEFIARANRLLWGDEPPARGPRDTIDDLMLAVASPLRLTYLQLSSEGILRALALAELALRRQVALSINAADLQSAMNLLQSFQPLITLVAHGDEPMLLSRKRGLKSPPFGDPTATFVSFAALRGLIAGTRGTLSVLESVCIPELSVADRSAILTTLGRYLSPALKKHRGAR